MSGWRWRPFPLQLLFGLRVYRHRSYRSLGECGACGARRDLMTVYFVGPAAGWYHRGRVDVEVAARVGCVDQRACRARLEKRRDRARVRRSLLVLVEPAAPGAPRGTCAWCGEAIVLADRPEAWRRGGRRYHRGDGWEEGVRDCASEFNRSRTWDSRRAIQLRGDPACVDCGSDGPWDADHEVALEDGGAHSMENLRRRCEPCHRAKTARENRARRAR